MSTDKDRAAAASVEAYQAERAAAATDERLAFINACDKSELQAMLAFLGGYSPTGFDHAVEMVTRDRAIIAQVQDGAA